MAELGESSLGKARFRAPNPFDMENGVDIRFGSPGHSNPVVDGEGGPVLSVGVAVVDAIVSRKGDQSLLKDYLRFEQYK